MHVGLQSGKSAVELASALRKSEVVKVLRQHGARIPPNKDQAFKEGLISKGHDLEERDQVHFSA
jgi:hypothetical protein